MHTQFVFAVPAHSAVAWGQFCFWQFFNVLLFIFPYISYMLLKDISRKIIFQFTLKPKIRLKKKLLGKVQKKTIFGHFLYGKK